MDLSNSMYDKGKMLVQVVLPGLAAAYLGLDALWDLPKENEVAGTIAVVATFLGLFLNRQAAKYDGAGDLVVHFDESDGTASLSADLNEDPAQFKDGTNVVMNVHRVDIPA